MSWFYLALLAPLLYAIVTLIDDNLLKYVYKSPRIATIFAGIFGSLPLLSRLFLYTAPLSTPIASIALIAGICTVIYYFYYFMALNTDTPSVVVALFGLAPATIPIFAHLFLNESLTVMQILGFSIVLLMSLGLSITNLKKFTFSKALLPVIAAVIFMDLASLLTKYAFEQSEFYPVYLCFSAGMGLGGLSFWLFGLNPLANISRKRSHAQLKAKLIKLFPLFLAVEITNLAAEFTLNLAISRGPVSLVKCMEATQPMFVLLIARLFYSVKPKYFRDAKAGRLKLKFVQMTVIIVGLFVIAIGSRHP